MTRTMHWASLLIALVCRPLLADFGGPIIATKATSPNGNLVVRILNHPTENKSNDVPTHLVCFYEFDEAKDAYERRSEFRLDESPGNLMFLSNSGDLVMIWLHETDAVRLYTRDGKLVKKWSLNELLIPDEIEACAQTGSTLQWFDEGTFQERQFYFNGPSQRVRAMALPFTVMRGPNPKTKFSGSLDAKNGKLRMNKSEEP